MYYTTKNINCQYLKKGFVFLVFLCLFVVSTISVPFAHAQQADGLKYTQEQVRTVLEGSLSAREALLRQLTNTGVNGGPAYQVGADGKFVLDRGGNKIPLPPGMLEIAVAKGAPPDLVKLLNNVIIAVRAEAAILDRCTNRFPISPEDAAKCFGDLKKSSGVIAQATDQVIPKLKETIKTVEEAWGIAVGGDAGRQEKLNGLRPALALAQMQKTEITASINNWSKYERGTLIATPAPKPPVKPELPAVDDLPPAKPEEKPPKSPFAPVEESDEPEPAAMPPLMLAQPMPRTRAEYEQAMQMIEAMIKQLDADYAAMKKTKK